jgi:signal transduction histidine kinase
MHEEYSDRGPAHCAEDRRLEQLRRLLSRIDTAQDEQRQTLARELHHKIVGSLSALKMECDWLLRPQRADEAMRPRLQRLSEELGQTIQFTRHLIGELWPAMVGHLGLGSALAQEVADVRARTGAAIELSIDGDVDGIPEREAVALYRVLHRVLEHCTDMGTAPCEARIALRRSSDTVALAIEVAAGALDEDDLVLMEERVSRLHGQFNRVSSQPGRMAIDVLIPAAP